MQEKYILNSYKQTQKLGENFAKEILKLPLGEKALVLGLRGNLGGGKTTFLQGFAKGLGIKEKILSPTFVIMKHFKFEILNFKFTDFYHIDCYRMNGAEEILGLGFENIIKNPCNIVAIEWPEKIEKFLPKNTILINFEFVDKNKRNIIISSKSPENPN